MRFVTERLSGDNRHLVDRFEQYMGDRLDEETIDDYILDEGGTAYLLRSTKDNTFFGHYLFRPLPKDDAVMVDRIVLAESWKALWLEPVLHDLFEKGVNPIQTKALAPIVMCPISDMLLAKALCGCGWFPHGERDNLWGTPCYEFEVPLDSFSDQVIAGRAKRARRR